MSFELLKSIRELNSFKYVLTQLVFKQLILRYRRTFFGYLWTLINPLAMMSIMAIVFSSLFKEDFFVFGVFLFSGMIPWNFFNSLLVQSALVLVQNEGLIKKIYLPKLIFPLSSAFAIFIDSLFSFIPLFLIVMLFGGKLSISILFLPVSFFLLFVFGLGLCLIVSTATVFFRDLQYLIQIGMQGLYFLTPILYKREDLAGRVKWLVDINPVTPFIELFRGPICMAQIPEIGLLIQTITLSLVSVVIGLVFFLLNEKKFVYRL